MKKRLSILSIIMTVVMASMSFTATVTAEENTNSYECSNVFSQESQTTLNDLSSLNFVYGDINGVSTCSTASNIYHINIAEQWIDTMRVSWTEGNTTAYHTLTCGVGDVYYSGWAQISSYTNHNGTYNDVYVLGVAPGTLFSCWEVYSSPSAGYNRWVTDCFGLETPRRLTEDEIYTLHLEGDSCYIIYDMDTNTVVDLYSNYLNPMIYAGWSNPTIVQ